MKSWAVLIEKRIDAFTNQDRIGTSILKHHYENNEILEKKRLSNFFLK